MKKTILSFGLIAGLIVIAMLIYSTYMITQTSDFHPSDTWGYVSMIVAFAFIFVGIKNVRDKYYGGTISFGKAFKTGFYIALIAATMYVVVWLIEYYLFIPDFMEKYSACVIKNAKADGATEAVLQEKSAQLAQFTEWYKNPLLVVLMTYAEILPLGVVIALISALILKRKKLPNQG